MLFSRRIIKDLAFGAVFVAVYFIAGKLGLKLAFVNVSVTAVWPPTGIALAGLLILGYRYWPAVLFGAFLVNWDNSGIVGASIGIAIGNTLEALLGAFLVNRYASGRRALENPVDVAKFSLLAGTFGPALSASIGVLTLVLGGLARATEFSSIWFTWWMGDMAGALIVAPFLLLWFSKEPLKWKDRQFFEAGAYILMLVLVSKMVFGQAYFLGISNAPLDFLFLPILLWVAFRFGRREAITAVVLVFGMAVWGTLRGFGPFVSSTPNSSLLLLQAFMATVGVTTLGMSALATERKRLEDNLYNYTGKLAEEKITDEALLASIGEGMIAVDKEEKIILVNKAFEDLLGWKSKEVIGHRTFEVIFMEDENSRQIPESKRPLNLAIMTGKRIFTTYNLVRKDKTKFPAAITATPLILDGKTVGAIKIFRDVSMEKQIDRAKTEFVSLASHQLRTPLTVVKWQAAQLLDELNAFRGPINLSAQKKSVENIYLTNQRMIELVNAILNVSKIDLGTLAIEPRLSSLTELADKMLDELRPEIEMKHLKVSKSYPAKIPKINIDVKLMRMVLQNLLTNAIKYTLPSGRINVKIELKKSQILLSISDTGCGILSEDQPKIFNKFFRTEMARQIDPDGNGLGLYIIKSILEETGGKIWFKSKVDKGTAFYVMLPLTGMEKTAGVKGLNESDY